MKDVALLDVNGEFVLCDKFLEACALIRSKFEGEVRTMKPIHILVRERIQACREVNDGIGNSRDGKDFVIEFRINGHAFARRGMTCEGHVFSRPVDTVDAVEFVPDCFYNNFKMACFRKRARIMLLQFFVNSGMFLEIFFDIVKNEGVV